MLRTILTGDVVTLERKLLARELIHDVRRLDRRIPPARKRIAEALAAYGTTRRRSTASATSAPPRSSPLSTTRRFPTPGHFAAFTGTAPLQASSGDVERHRMSRRGNRQMNKVLHTAAKTQIRRGCLGRTYYDRKLADGKSSMEAARAQAAAVPDVIYRRLLADHQARAARGGQVRTSPRAA